MGPGEPIATGNPALTMASLAVILSPNNFSTSELGPIKNYSFFGKSSSKCRVSQLENHIPDGLHLHLLPLQQKLLLQYLNMRLMDHL